MYQGIFLVIFLKFFVVWGKIKFDPLISLECKQLRDAFANASSEFIKCSIDHSRPITFCESCVTQYLNVSEGYKNMSRVVNGTPCIDNFVNLDRLGIVHTLYENSLNLWREAKCYECYISKDGAQTKDFSNETRTFNRLFKDFDDCLNRTITENICDGCMHSYSTMQDYFYSISNENDKIGVCMDIVDTMNTTWTYWGEKCCKFRRHNEYVFIGSTVVVLVATLLFYILAQIGAKSKTPTIIQQSRFAEVVNSSRS